ncbi:hypothetical protein [Novosphingobium sp. FKTRR1]|uniref:hypothetical protein n=1 Tax=Novosphingobium sp. FKTRR1 TaxID=2879118 RepID=UPI001CEFC5B4|nr:hypothetical protein [Novosphingobium sp. FKTRR1]
MIALPEIAAEIAREAAARRATYPAMIARLKMTEQQAAAEYALCAAWSSDLARYADWMNRAAPRAPIVPVARQHGFIWADRRHGITRELDRRARLYPRWIAAGQLDQAEADQRTARLSALADIYDDGFDWHDSFGTRPPFGRRFARDDDHTPAEAEAIRQWWTHVHATLSARYGTSQQEALHRPRTGQIF